MFFVEKFNQNGEELNIGGDTMYHIEKKAGLKRKELNFQEEIKNLEQRGYDSSGIIVHTSHGISREKRRGPVEFGGFQWNEQPYSEPYETQQHEANSYLDLTPYTYSNGPLKFTIILKGTIDNYKALKKHIIEQGYTFKSEGCSEVVTYMILNEYNGSLVETVQRVTGQLEGDYILVVMT
jgi:glutamine---fructose-6-phosphate transaminase (isomerizing)